MDEAEAASLLKDAGYHVVSLKSGGYVVIDLADMSTAECLDLGELLSVAEERAEEIMIPFRITAKARKAGRSGIKPADLSDAAWADLNAICDRYREIREGVESLIASGHVEQARDANGDLKFRPNRDGVLEPVWTTTDDPFP
jgi:hypothetical protein